MPLPRSDDEPIYTALVAQWRARDQPASHHGDGYGPAGGGRHGWDDAATGPILMGRHHDLDEDGVADQGAVFDPDDAPEFPDPGWRPESDFTGEWIDGLLASDSEGAS